MMVADDIAVCSTSWKYWLLPSVCWEYSPSAWKEAAAFKTPPPPPAVKPPADLINPPTNGVQAEQTISNILDAQVSDWQQQNQTFFDSQPYVAADNSTLYAWLAAGAAAVALLMLLRK
jgi:hypothetical protein